MSDPQESQGSRVGGGGDNHMARLVPSLCFHTWTPERDSGYCLHLTDEALRGTVGVQDPTARELQAMLLQDTLQAFMAECFQSGWYSIPPEG